MSAAHGIHSNVVLNLRAREAVALAALVRGAMVTDEAALAAIEKVLAAGARAEVPWSERV